MILDRGKHTRSRNGCITCKARKKKCDEVKPRCAGCRRNQLVCEWPGRIMKSGHESTLSVAPPVPVLTRTRSPCTLTPLSILLLRHYLVETAAIVVMAPSNKNPCITVLLPLGHTDDLLMHGLLALSGAHMSHAKRDVADTASLHYSLLVSQLRVEFSSLREDDLKKRERLLRVLLVMCQYEVGDVPPYADEPNRGRPCLETRMGIYSAICAPVII
jgi:hypothetical protein